MRIGPYVDIMVLVLMFCGADWLVARNVPENHKRIPVAVSAFAEWAQQKAGEEEVCRIYELDGERFARVGRGGAGRWVFLTGDFAVFTGYRGWTNCLIEMEGTGCLVAIEVVDSRDTPPYVRRIVRRGFCQQFLGTNGEDRARSPDDLDVDVVSGATLTCQAIARSVAASRKAVRALLTRIKIRVDGSLELLGEGELKELTPAA